MKNNKKQSPTDTQIQRNQQEEKETQREPARSSGLTVVGIGASAGGLKALQDFFETLPDDTSLAFVVVTHLAPEHESHLAEILQNRTGMRVSQVNGRIDVVANNVYVIPPNREIFMADSQLDLKPFQERRGTRTPVDHFFRSLASVHHGAIAIILSGGGTDGAVGIKDVKEQGGLLMVQHPDEAEYESMPRAAIATGLADVVLPVRELAQKLMDFIIYRPQVPSDPEALTKEQRETIQRILEQVNLRNGHDFSQYKRSTILRRIKRRMQLTGHESLEAYLAYMHNNQLEVGSMFNDILIGVTNFFRDPKSWQVLAERVIPSIFEGKKNGEPIRIWAIGCATGEEAYSLAILFTEQRNRLEANNPIQVFASDLDEGSLARARDGLYPSAIETDVSWKRLDRFFLREDSHYQVKRELREMVLFANHSVLRDPPFSRLDLISCRNLLIYLQPEMQRNVFGIFHYALNPGGFIFLGSAESAESVNELFQVMDKEHRVYQARDWRGQHPHVPSMPLTVRLPESGKLVKLPRPLLRSEEIPSLEREHQQSLESHAPPSILIDERYHIVYLSESAGRYLLQPKGIITNDLLKLVRPELHLELRAALLQTFNTRKAVLTKPVAVTFNGHPHRVIISVHPRQGNAHQEADSERQALVFFLEDEVAEPQEKSELSGEYRQDDRSQALVAQLESEGAYLREQLQTVTEEYESSNEEMKAANEELQSINEEYRSATEELETSKEELQSVNEELQTVNSELKGKLEEISRAHSDLENLMGTTEIALLFLDRDMRIQRYTSGMRDIFNLMDTDKGRPINHLTSKLAYSQIVKDAEQVLRELIPVEREISTEDGLWYLVRLRPYRTADDRIDGVVIGIVDITATKNSAERTQQNYESFYTLFHANPIPTLLTRLEDGMVMNVNLAFLNYLGIQRQDVVGHTAKEFHLGLDLTSRQRIGLTAKLLQDGNIRNFEEEIAFPTGEVKSVMTSVQYIWIENTDALISTFIDITERVRAEHHIRQLSIQLTKAEQEERSRISQVLHDDLQQRIFAVKMQLENAEESLRDSKLPTKVIDFAKLDAWLAEAIAITRQLSTDLSPLNIKGENLTEVILWLSSQMKEKYGLEVELSVEDEPLSIGSNLQILIFHAIRELLFNVVKHSGTLNAKIGIRKVDQGRTHIILSDEGVGFDVQAVLRNEDMGHGLAIIHQRLLLFGCRLEIDSAAGRGTQVTIDCPLEVPRLR